MVCYMSGLCSIEIADVSCLTWKMAPSSRNHEYILLENWGKRKKMFSFVVSKIFSPYYTSSKAFAYSLSRG